MKTKQLIQFQRSKLSANPHQIKLLNTHSQFNWIMVI